MTIRTYDELITLLADNTSGDITPAVLRDFLDSVFHAKRISVTDASQLSGTLDPTMEYFIDGHIDMGAVTIEVPVGGLVIRGYNTATSKLFSSSNNYTMFNSAAPCGTVLVSSLDIEVTGTSSEVYNLTGTSFAAIELDSVNYSNCTSLGTLTTFRQGLEINTARFGGTPTLLLAGAWGGGFRVSTSIVRILDAGYADVLFKQGTDLTFGSRFISDINADFPTTSCGFTDFDDTVFPTNAADLEMVGGIFTIAGVSDPDNTPSIFKGLVETSINANFTANRGIHNTFTGGRLEVTTEAPTTINTIGVFEPVVASTWTASQLVHYAVGVDQSRLEHLDHDHSISRVTSIAKVTGTSGDEVHLRLQKFTADGRTVSTVAEHTQEISKHAGASVDFAMYHFIEFTELDAGDGIYLEVANLSSTNSVTVALGALLLVEPR